MKSSLMALAVLGALSGAASAQSSVTLYGIVDIGVQWNEFGVNVGTTAAPNWQQNGVWGVESGYQSGSRFGIRGSEALGGGWSAVFTLEGGLDVSTGTSAQGGRLFGRQSWAGLQSNRIGTFALGRISTPSSGGGAFDLWSGVSPFGVTWGLNSIGSTFIPSASLREDNSIIWASPTWAGFKVAAQYSFNVNLAETAPQGSNTSAVSLGANWTWGPLFLAATYDVIDYPDATTSTPCVGTVNGCPDQKMLQLGGTYDFKFLKLHAAYADQSNISTVMTLAGVGGAFQGTFIPTGIGNYNNNAWMIGVTVPLFGGSLLGSYQYSDAKNIISPTGAQFEPDYNVWGIGYSYPFSRRTNIYIGYAQRDWDGRITATTAAGSGTLTQVSQFFDRAQFALGVRHLF